MDHIVKKLLSGMSNVKSSQRKFMIALFSVLMVFQGKATFLNINIERYSSSTEIVFSAGNIANSTLLSSIPNCCYTDLKMDMNQLPRSIPALSEKSDRKVTGLHLFFNGSVGESLLGLEISMICISELQSNTASRLDTCQAIDQKDRSGIDLHAEYADWFVPKLHELKTFGKLRVNADLLWLNTVVQVVPESMLAK
ncbi:hypothetical protein ACJJID_09025 [Microbulbifer sp. CnH-101-G]|uniref:hypothetical protein n=1 Tax=Microbulbifer sp. CnH-101-G TaxID=3243393 RepID=UPI00403A529B